MDDKAIVRSAGGIVARKTENNRLQLLLIHRAKQNDWSFPKGRLELAETAEMAALREVLEETGCQCSLDRELPTLRYIDRHGHPKEVRYWLMTVVNEGPFTPNPEIDQIKWLTFLESFETLSYKMDRVLLKLAFA